MNFEACIECSLTKLWGSGYNLKGKILKLCLNWVLNFSRLIANSTFYWGYFPVIYMSLSRSSVSTEDIHVGILPFFSFRLFLIFSIEFVRDSFIYFPGFFFRDDWEFKYLEAVFCFSFLFVHFRVRDKNPCNHKIS